MNIRWILGGVATLALLFAGESPSFADVDQVRIRLETTDTQGNPISMIHQEQDFLVRAYVQDLREPAEGVFSAYMDLTYPFDHVAVVGDVEHASPYLNVKTGTVTEPGLLNEVGALGGLSPAGAGERLLYSVPFNASKAGNVVFATDPAESLIGEVLLYGSNELVSLDRVDFGSTAFSIFPQACDLAAMAGPLGDVDGDLTVGFSDFLTLAANFGAAAEDPSMADLDCDGMVGFGDFLIISEAFGDSLVSIAAVPEPASWAMLVASAFLMRFRRPTRS